MNEAEERKIRHRVNRDDFINAVAELIYLDRQAGLSSGLGPRYAYMNTRVFEDEIAPALTEVGEDGEPYYLWEELKIEIRHSRKMPPDRFSFTKLPYPVDEVAKHLRQHEALPDRA